MELKGEQLIPLEPATVWAGLNDPDVLRAAIPGCESIEKIGDDGYKLVMMAAVGPVKARFNGKLTLSNVQPPQSYTLIFEGTGGAVGFGKGKADVALAAAEGGTLLTYAASVQVGGKIAQVGSRLIDGVAAKMATEFFTRFKAELAPPAPADSQEEPAARQESGRRWKFWGSAGNG